MNKHMTDTNKNKKDLKAKLLALRRWFESQEISTAEASCLCAMLIGAIMGARFDSKRTIKGGMRMLFELAERTARDVLKLKEDIQ